MSEARNRNREISQTRELNSEPPHPNLSQTLNDFLRSLGEILIDITALEVNTMVVEQISGDKFIPWETYRDIYPISRQYLEQKGIHESLRDRYLELRKTLELEYTLLLTDPKSEFYDPIVLNAVREDNKILTEPTVELEEIQTKLPNPIQPTRPEEILNAKKLLNNSRFLRSLRKISELKAALDSRNKTLLRKQAQQSEYIQSEALQKSVTTDMIYAQTVIQLDGDVINRYSEQIFDHPHREMLLQIHKQGVTAGEQQWRGLLKFIIGMVQSSLNLRSVRNGWPWGSSK